jgi:hypothetical protein
LSLCDGIDCYRKDHKVQMGFKEIIMCRRTLEIFPKKTKIDFSEGGTMAELLVKRSNLKRMLQNQDKVELDDIPLLYKLIFDQNGTGVYFSFISAVNKLRKNISAKRAWFLKKVCHVPDVSVLIHPEKLNHFTIIRHLSYLKYNRETVDLFEDYLTGEYFTLPLSSQQLEIYMNHKDDDLIIEGKIEDNFIIDVEPYSVQEMSMNESILEQLMNLFESGSLNDSQAGKFIKDHFRSINNYNEKFESSSKEERKLLTIPNLSPEQRVRIVEVAVEQNYNPPQRFLYESYHNSKWKDSVKQRKPLVIVDKDKKVAAFYDPRDELFSDPISFDYSRYNMTIKLDQYSSKVPRTIFVRETLMEMLLNYFGDKKKLEENADLQASVELDKYNQMKKIMEESDPDKRADEKISESSEEFLAFRKMNGLSRHEIFKNDLTQQPISISFSQFYRRKSSDDESERIKKEIYMIELKLRTTNVPIEVKEGSFDDLVDFPLLKTQEKHDYPIPLNTIDYFRVMNKDGRMSVRGYVHDFIENYTHYNLSDCTFNVHNMVEGDTLMHLFNNFDHLYSNIAQDNGLKNSMLVSLCILAKKHMLHDYEKVSVKIEEVLDYLNLKYDLDRSESISLSWIVSFIMSNKLYIRASRGLSLEIEKINFISALKKIPLMSPSKIKFVDVSGENMMCAVRALNLAFKNHNIEMPEKDLIANFKLKALEQATRVGLTDRSIFSVDDFFSVETLLEVAYEEGIMIIVIDEMKKIVASSRLIDGNVNEKSEKFSVIAVLNNVHYNYVEVDYSESN